MRVTGAHSGCVEVGAFGKENYNLTGYFNMPKVLEITLNNGDDPLYRQEIGLQTGRPALFTFMKNYSRLMRNSSVILSMSRSRGIM